jgi:hypothetical protein
VITKHNTFFRVIIEGKKNLEHANGGGGTRRVKELCGAQRHGNEKQQRGRKSRPAVAYVNKKSISECEKLSREGRKRLKRANVAHASWLL